MSDAMFRKESRWQHGNVVQFLPRQTTNRVGAPLLIGLALVVVASLMIALFVGGRDNTAVALSLPTSTSAPTPTAQPTPAPLVIAVPLTPPTPSCVSGATYLDAIQLHEKQGNWSAAASTAELASRLHDLCSTDRRVLSEKAVSAGLEAMFSQPLPAYTDVAAHQHVVTLYQSLKRQAEEAGVPFPTSIQIATRAYQGGLFLLSQAAYEEAWREGSFTQADQSLIQQYTAALFNQGYHMVLDGHGKTFEDGLQLLATCYKVDTTYRVGSGACWGELRNRLGEDESMWPKPTKTPLLPTR